MRTMPLKGRSFGLMELLGFTVGRPMGNGRREVFSETGGRTVFRTERRGNVFTVPAEKKKKK